MPHVLWLLLLSSENIKWVRFALPTKPSMISSQDDENSSARTTPGQISPGAPPSDIEVSSDSEDEMENETVANGN